MQFSQYLQTIIKACFASTPQDTSLCTPGIEGVHMHVMLQQAICAYLERQCELLVYIFGPDPTSSNEKGSQVYILWQKYRIEAL